MKKREVIRESLLKTFHKEVICTPEEALEVMKEEGEFPMEGVDTYNDLADFIAEFLNDLKNSYLELKEVV